MDCFAACGRNSLRGMGEQLLALVCESAPREQLAAWLRVPLEHAAAKGDFDCVMKLLAAGAGAFVRRSNVSDRSPLIAAAQGGNGAIVSALLESGSAPNGEGWEPFVAGDESNVIIAGSSASGSEGSNTSSTSSTGRWSPLHFAASGGHVAAVRALIRAGADIDVEDEEGCSAFHLSVFRGFEEVAEELVAAGANLDTSDSEGETPLHTACSHGNLVMVKAILRSSRAEALCARENGGVYLQMSPLHRAALGGHCGVMRELLGHGSNPYFLAGNSRTALHTSAMSGSADAVRFLLDRDISSIEAKDQEGSTALHLAAGHRLGSDGTLRALLIAGADIEAKTALGETSLHKACKALRVSAVQILLRWEADETAVDADGRTPAAMASQLLQSQFPGVFRDMLDEILRMVANAKVDRAWRRRGWLLMLRSRQQNIRPIAGKSGYGGLREGGSGGGPRSLLLGCEQQLQPSRSIKSEICTEQGGQGRPPKMAKVNEAAVQSRHASGAEREEKSRSGGVEGETGGGDRHMMSTTEGFAGSDVEVELKGEGIKREGEWSGGGDGQLALLVVKRAIGVDEEGVFRTIIAFL